MIPVLLALILSCFAQACLGLPSLTQIETVTDANTIVIPVSYSQWFRDSTVLVSVNDAEMSLTVGNANFAIAPPADGNVVIKTSSPHGLTCLAPGPLPVAKAELGVVIPCATTLRFTTQQPASYVLGQANMTTVAVGPGPYVNDMNLPWGLATERSTNPNWLFVADELYNRVLVYQLPITHNQPDASFLLGQNGDFSGTANAASQPTMSQPLSLDVVDGTLVVADANNNRVLIFHGIPTNATAVPDTVVGQPTFATAAPGCDAGSMQFPFAAIQAGGRLYVADSKNNRVLMWLTTPRGTPSALPADGALGQPNLTTCGVTTPPTATTFNTPRGLHWDGNYFFILDSSNNRVLIYEGLPNPSTVPSYLIGQQDYQSNQACGVDTCLYTPKGLVTDANSIFVVDTYNNRVLGFHRNDVFNNPGSAQPRPYMVLGQAATSNSSTVSDPDNQSSVTFYSPSAAAIVDSQLFVSDTFNFRVLVFDSM